MVNSDINKFQGFFLEFAPKILFGRLCKVRPLTPVFLRTFKSKYSCIEVNTNSIGIKIAVNIVLAIFS